MSNLWGALWRSENFLDGKTQHILYENLYPKLFRRRQDCREWIKEQYGYIADRPDLQSEPHGWRMPIPVKVEVIYSKR